MELTWTDSADSYRTITLIGRFDMDGASEIDLKLTALTSVARIHAVLDLTRVDFLASLGIATQVRVAKSARLRGGKVVLLNPQPNVAKALAITRIDDAIPVCYDRDQALAILRDSMAASRS